MVQTAQHTQLCYAYQLGLVDYTQASQLQEQLVEARLSGQPSDSLLLLQHPNVITIGASGAETNILATSEILKKASISMAHTDRGGDVTYHSPGQLVAYPIFDLRRRGRDIHRYVRDIEEVVIRTLSYFSITGQRQQGYPGVWVGEDKICALGIRVRGWITKHGLALNVNNDLQPFEFINPCGVKGLKVTSMRLLLGCEVEISQVAEALTRHFASIFDTRIQTKSWEGW